jgi:hypothetical protein
MEDNIKLNLKETEYDNVDWISLVQDRIRLPILHTLIKLCFTQKGMVYVFLPGKRMSYSQEEFC